MAVNPRLHWPGGLSVRKAGSPHVAVNRLPIDGEWSHPHCELIDRIVCKRFLNVNLQQHRWRNQHFECFCRTMKSGHFSNRRFHDESVFKWSHIDFLITLIGVRFRFRRQASWIQSLTSTGQRMGVPTSLSILRMVSYLCWLHIENRQKQRQDFGLGCWCDG